MVTRTLTRLLMGIGLLCATIAWSGWAYLHTVAAPHRVEDVADAVLDDPDARFEIAGPLADQIVQQAAIDPAFTPQIRDAVATAMADPRVVANVTDAFGSMHARAVGVVDDRPATIDTAVLIAAVKEHLAVADPQAAALIPDAAIGNLHLPDVHPPLVASLRRIAVACTNGLALLAVGLIGVALVIGDRKYALRRFGVWAILAGASWAIGPRLLILGAHRWAPDADATLATAITAATKMVTVVATVLVAAGIGAIIGAQFVGMQLIPEPSSGPAPVRYGPRIARTPGYAMQSRAPAPPPPRRPTTDVFIRPAAEPPSGLGHLGPPLPTMVMRPQGRGVGQFTAPSGPAPTVVSDEQIDPWAHFAQPAAPSTEPLDEG